METEEIEKRGIRRKGFFKLALGVVAATFSILSYPGIAPVSGMLLLAGGAAIAGGVALDAISPFGGGKLFRMLGGAIATAGAVGLASPAVGVALGLEGAYNMVTKKDTPAELPLSSYMPKFIRDRLPTPSVAYNIAKLYGEMAFYGNVKNGESERYKYEKALVDRFKRGTASEKDNRNVIRSYSYEQYVVANAQVSKKSAIKPRFVGADGWSSLGPPDKTPEYGSKKRSHSESIGNASDGAGKFAKSRSASIS